MADSIVVRKVENKRDFQKLFNLPWKIYRDDPNWVAPLRMLRAGILDRKENPAWHYLKGEYFIAERNGEVVGSIAAIVNPLHNKHWNENAGFFGAFECIDDAEASAGLFKAAENWLREQRVDIIRGPVTLTVWEEYGLLVHGFEPPAFLIPYHRPYYQTLIEQAGFTKAADTFSYIYDWNDVAKQGTYERFNKLAARILRDGTITVRPVDGKRLKEEFLLFQKIFNEAWSENYGFIPMTDAERDAIAQSVGLIFNPKLGCVVEVRGDPAAFMIAIPDMNQALRHVHQMPRQLEAFRLIEMLWHWKIRRKTDRARIPLLGVREQYRKIGVDLLLYKYIIDAMRDNGYNSLYAGWIVETNTNTTKVMDNLKMRHFRTHRIYEKPL